VDLYQIAGLVLIGILGNTALIGIVFKVLLFAFESKVEKIAQREIGYLALTIKANEEKAVNKFDSLFNKIDEVKNKFMEHVIEDVKSFMELKSDMESIIEKIEKIKDELDDLKEGR
jgi:hypothetical protein